MSVTLKDAAEHLDRIGFATTQASNIILAREALERGISVTKPDGRNYMTLSSGGRSYRWRSGINTLNSVLARRLTRYKDATNALLRSQGVAAAENLLARPGDVDRAWAWAQPFSASVLKSNHRNQGRHVHVAVTGEQEFREAFAGLAASLESSVLVEKHYTGVEYRCVVTNGEVVAAARMRAASVLGDGASSITQLVREKNRERKHHPSHRRLRLDEGELVFLADQGLTPSSVPQDGARVMLSPVASLRHGGDAIDATESLTPEQLAVVAESVRVIPGLGLAGVDVLFDVEDAPEGHVVLEVSPSPAIALHHHPWEGEARNVADAVLDAMFRRS